MIVSFVNYKVPPKYDGSQWLSALIQEADNVNGPWADLETQALDPQADPAVPEPISLTTNLATLAPGFGWYRISFFDGSGHQAQAEPVFNAASTEIMATLGDINAHLDGNIIEATWDN